MFILQIKFFEELAVNGFLSNILDLNLSLVIFSIPMFQGAQRQATHFISTYQIVS